VGLALGCALCANNVFVVPKTGKCKICVESTTKHCQQKVASLSVILLEGFLIRINSKLIRELGRKPIIFSSWSIRQLAARVKISFPNAGLDSYRERTPPIS
jgi:hypothetical protein